MQEIKKILHYKKEFIKARAFDEIMDMAEKLPCGREIAYMISEFGWPRPAEEEKLDALTHLVTQLKGWKK